jgi:hypothetical protein
MMALLFGLLALVLLTALAAGLYAWILLTPWQGPYHSTKEGLICAESVDGEIRCITPEEAARE